MRRKFRKNNIIPEFIAKKPELKDFGYTEESIQNDNKFYEKEKNKIQNIFLFGSKCNKAIIASTRGFTKGVFDFCCDKNIEHWDIEKIIEFKNNLSVT